ncbi:MAG TPA: PAS domain S-box protein [Dongiaceae bacterium]|nr:PAS domain S-box protein [Dongiaceae bacterium]
MLVYMVVAGIYILASDTLVKLVGLDPEKSFLISIAKGLSFVLVTGLMLYVLIRRLLGRLEQTQVALAVSEYQLDATLDHARLFIGLLAPDGRLLQANRVALEFVHATAAEVLGRLFWETPWWNQSPERQARLREFVKQAATGQAVAFADNMPDSLGRMHFFECKITPIHDEAGRVAYLVPQAYDITTLKETETLLRHEKERLDRACVAGKIALYEWNLLTDDLEWSGSVDFMLGFPLGELPRTLKAWEARIHSEDLPAESEALQRHLAGTVPYDVIYRIQRVDGTYVWWHDVGMAERTPEGKPYRMAGTCVDITERKRVEEALQTSNDKLNSLLRAAPTGIGMIVNRTIKQVNAQICQMLGYAEAELLEQSSRILYADDAEFERIGREKYEQIRKRGSGTVEAQWRRKDGAIIDVLLSSTPIDPGDVAAGVTFTALDITERKQMDEALRASRQMLQTVLDNFPGVIFWKNCDSVFLGCNQQFARAAGLADSAEILGKTDFDLAWAGPGAEQYRAVDREVIASGVPRLGIIETQRRADGQVTWLDTSKIPLMDGQGKVIGLLGISHDITESKRAEAALRQNESRLQKINRCLLALGPDYHANLNRLTELCGELLDASFAVYSRKSGDQLRMVGHWQLPPGFKPTPELTGQVCRDIIESGNDEVISVINLPEAAPPGLAANIQAHGLRTHMGCAVRCQGQTVGAVCVFFTSDYRPSDDDRRILGIIAAAIGNEDTRQQVEAELRRVMTAIEQTPESVVITAADGSILYVNPVFERTTGYTRAEIIGQNPRTLKSDKHDPAFYHEMWAKLLAGEVWQGRLVNRKKDGTLFTEDATIAPVRDAQGDISNFIAVKRDITQELARENEYLQNQKIDSIGRLAGGVAHDFNNILAVICGHAELGLAELSADSSVRANLQAIRESADRAVNLTRQLLAFARRQVIEPRVVNLNDLISNLSKMLLRLIGEDIELVRKTDPNLGRVKVDPGQMDQVLLNLAVNARDAMPEGGVLTITTTNVSLDEAYVREHLGTGATPGEYVLINVSDNGVGMTAEVRKHLFEPFFTTKETGRGTGLGLATCFGIIQQNHGYIQCDSELGRGTTFQVFLPRIDEAAVITAPEVQGNLPRGTEKILLAEDEKSLRQLISRVLRNQGYTVFEAGSGDEALRLAQTHGEIDLLLTDVVMPGLNGRTLSEWMEEAFPGIKVLFISGYIGSTVVRDAMMKPGTHFLQKPFSPSDLAKKVRVVLDTAKPT